MDAPVLVAYATKHGSTEEIARRVARGLQDRGLKVELQDVREVQDPSPYTAVVLGSAVYIGQWRKEATEFLTRNETILALKPVWLFSSGPTGEGDPIELLKGFRAPQSLMPIIERIEPREIVVFHGDLDPKQLGWMERFVIKGVEAPIGDFRQWEQVDRWAAAIAESLKVPAA
jgi:menaquinone-dependent protoporphyrinogen oxidase